ncbi:hypothetical protein H0H81_008411 [Sphagnurus paluster]|uniref:Uncharacterized protein n=1 Tax=Sphagnurus paluster TaxID=117069 RepID=A0A9P7FWX7_9AGAR|nr:hypothetical protein H0H81_008411 [Sphagnurus paluster]
MLQDNGKRAPRTAASLGHDEAVLARLGYKQEFRRVFSPVEVFGVGFSIIGLIPSMAYVCHIRQHVFYLMEEQFRHRLLDSERRGGSYGLGCE